MKMQLNPNPLLDITVKNEGSSNEVKDYWDESLGVPKPRNSNGQKPRVIILGAGWAGYNFGNQISKENYDVTLISPRNHFLFTPLLASTTVGTLEYKCIQEPVRSIKDLNYRQAECSTIDFKNKKLSGKDVFGCTSFEMDYDYLIVACGMTNRTFNTPGLSEENRVFFLKSLSDAKKIRSRMIDCFERAANPDLPLDEKKRLLNFMIVGGGPTCIEFAGELDEFIK